MTSTRFTQMPSVLRAAARWERLGPDAVPAMLAHPHWDGEPAPVVIWMHGRTVAKEIDPGRYLRWLRAGIATCALDLPGHGERYDRAMQPPERSFEVVRGMLDELDGVVAALADHGPFDMRRVGIGGMSAGGMVTLARLCREHTFQCASVEATSGSWTHQQHRRMFRGQSSDLIAMLDPIAHLDTWREIPFQAFHHRLDKWVRIDGQEAFVTALQEQYEEPALIDWVVFDEPTGAPYEHAGFGRRAAEVKNRQVEFFSRHLTPSVR